jgi:hypothetical protein
VRSETFAAVPLQPMPRPVLAPRRIPRLTVVAPEVIDAFLQEPFRLIGTHQMQGQALLEQETPCRGTLRSTAWLPAELAIDPPGVQGVGDT